MTSNVVCFFLAISSRWPSGILLNEGKGGDEGCLAKKGGFFIVTYTFLSQIRNLMTFLDLKEFYFFQSAKKSLLLRKKREHYFQSCDFFSAVPANVYSL